MSEAATATPPAGTGGDQGGAAAPQSQQAPPAAGGGFLNGDGGGEVPSQQAPPKGGQEPPQQAQSARPTLAALFSESIVEGGAFKEGWTEQLETAGLERLANKAKLVKEPDALFRSLDEALGMVGKKQAAGYPDPSWSDQDVASFRKAAGVPEAADQYELTPDQLPDGVEFGDEERQALAEVLHRHHVPAEAAKELLGLHLEQAGALAAKDRQAMTGKIEELFGQSEARFRKEWGDGYDSRLQANKDFIATRFDADELADPLLQAALSHPKIVQAFDEARRALRGAPLPGIGAEIAAHSMNPAQQAQEIMKADRNWQNDPEKVAKVNELYSLQAKQDRRSR